MPALERYRRDGAAGVVTASTGNHGAATAWAAEQLGLSRDRVRPRGREPDEARTALGVRGEVVVTGADVDEAKEGASAYAETAGLPFFEDGAEPAQLDGYAAIGNEILDQLDEEPAAVVVPVGNGALLAGIGRALGARSPRRDASASSRPSAPVMALVVACGPGGRVRPLRHDRRRAGGARRDSRRRRLAAGGGDEMLEVSEREIAAAVVAYDDAGIRAEAAAAAALAALPHVGPGRTGRPHRHRPKHRR